MGRSARRNSKPSFASKASWTERTSLGNSTTARQLAELGLAGGYNLYEGGGHGSTDPDVLMKTLAVYGALRGSRALGSHIDERVVKHVAQLLTSNNARDLDKGIKLISRNKTLFKAIQNADAAAGARWDARRCVWGD